MRGVTRAATAKASAASCICAAIAPARSSTSTYRRGSADTASTSRLHAMFADQLRITCVEPYMRNLRVCVLALCAVGCQQELPRTPPPRIVVVAPAPKPPPSPPIASKRLVTLEPVASGHLPPPAFLLVRVM